MQNGSSVGICTHCTHFFARLAQNLYAQSVLISKISALELSRKFINDLLLVGRVLEPGCFLCLLCAGPCSMQEGEESPTNIGRLSNIAEAFRGKIDRSSLIYSTSDFYLPVLPCHAGDRQIPGCYLVDTPAMLVGRERGGRP